MKIYRYRNINQFTIESLKNGELFFADPKDFNDPLDSKYNKINLDSALKFLETMIKKKMTDYEIAYLLSAKKMLVDVYEGNYNNKICCFSEINNDILMWSHYANSHKGICLIFETEELDQFNFFPLSSESIELPEQRLSFKASTGKMTVKEKTNSEIFDFYNFPLHKVRYYEDFPDAFVKEEGKLVNYFLLKNISWKYEREHRIIVQNSMIKSNPIKYDKNCMTGIIFGCNTPKKDIELIIDLINTNYNNKVDFYLTVLNGYNIEIKDL